MVDRQDMNLLVAHDPIDDAVRPMNDLANNWILELWNGPTGFRKVGQPIGGRDELSHNN